MISHDDLGDAIRDLGDHTTDPDRPFTGQPHTDQGERGKTMVEGLRFRDLADCAVRAFVDSCPPLDMDPDSPEWKEHAALRRRADDGTLNYNDLFGLSIDEMDPVAFIQNLGCRVEKAMGIYPNVPGKERR